MEILGQKLGDKMKICEKTINSGMDLPSADEFIRYCAIIIPDISIFLKVRSEYVRGILR
jgi:hypothetical protein